MASIDLKILDQRLRDERYAPQYATPGSAGIDLRACIEMAIKIHPGETILVPTGIAIHLIDSIKRFTDLSLGEQSVDKRGTQPRGKKDHDDPGKNFFHTAPWDSYPLLWWS